MLFYGQSPELMFFKTSGVGRKDVSSKDVNNKGVESIDVSSYKNCNKKSNVLLVFLIKSTIAVFSISLI
jgi:hypothetical protein